MITIDLPSWTVTVAAYLFGCASTVFAIAIALRAAVRGPEAEQRRQAER